MYCVALARIMPYQDLTYAIVTQIITHFPGLNLWESRPRKAPVLVVKDVVPRYRKTLSYIESRVSC